MKYDYPVTPQLIRKLKEEYRYMSIKKGNTWRNDTTLKYLRDKVNEENIEVQLASNNKDMKEEIIDLILVACMLYERLEND